jgi:hypothetical protein
MLFEKYPPIPAWAIQEERGLDGGGIGGYPPTMRCQTSPHICANTQTDEGLTVEGRTENGHEKRNATGQGGTPPPRAARATDKRFPSTLV